MDSRTGAVHVGRVRHVPLEQPPHPPERKDALHHEPGHDEQRKVVDRQDPQEPADVEVPRRVPEPARFSGRVPRGSRMPVIRNPLSTKNSRTPISPQSIRRSPGTLSLPQCSNQTASTAKAQQRVQLRHVPHRQWAVRGWGSDNRSRAGMRTRSRLRLYCRDDRADTIRELPRGRQVGNPAQANGPSRRRCRSSSRLRFHKRIRSSLGFAGHRLRNRKRFPSGCGGRAG